MDYNSTVSEMHKYTRDEEVQEKERTCREWHSLSGWSRNTACRFTAGKVVNNH